MVATPDGWTIDATPDPQLVDPDWDLVNQSSIVGVAVKSVKHVMTNNGYLTEIFRADWGLPGDRVDQVFSRTLEPHAVSAWHCHAVTTDRLFCVAGRLLIVLYDGRRASSSAGALQQIRVGVERPALVVVPKGVWHGVKNLSATPSVMINAVDEAYAYAAPDHWRIDRNDPRIPFDFAHVG